MCWTGTRGHQHPFQTEKQPQNYVAAPTIRTLAPYWLCHHLLLRLKGCLGNKSNSCQRQLLDWPPPWCVPKIRLGKAHRGRNRQHPKLNTEALKHDWLAVKYQDKLSEKLQPIKYLSINADTEIDSMWDSLKTPILDSCKESVGFSKHRHQDWFADNEGEILQLLEEKTCSLHSLATELPRSFP